MKHLPHAFALLVLVACGSDSGVEPPLPSNLARMEARVVDRIESAARELRADPNDAKGWAHLGMIYEANEMFVLALECYGRAIEIRPAAKWWYRSAITQSNLGRIEAAARAMRRSIEIRGDYAPAHWRLGGLLFDLGRFDDANATYVRATRVDPDHLGGWTGLARVRLQRGEAEQAVEILERLLVSNPEEPYVLRLLKGAYVQAGRQVDAANLNVAWRRRSSLGKDPWHREFRAYRERPVMEKALDDLQSGRSAQAVVALEEFTVENPGDLNAVSYLAWGYFQLNRRDEAWTVVREGLAVDDRYIQLLRVVSRMHEASGELDDAIRILARIVAIDANDVDAWRKKGHLERKQGLHEAAVESLRTVFVIDRRDPKVLIAAGGSQLTLERWEDAAGTFREAIEAGATGPGAYVGLARALVELGSYDAAENALRAAPRLGEDGVELLDSLPRIRQEGGRG